MIDNVVRDLQVLGKADSLGRIWLNVMARPFSLFALAGLIVVFGHGMANVAGLYGLQQSSGPKDTIASFVERPLNTAAENLLVPAALSILRGLRSKKGQG